MTSPVQTWQKTSGEDHPPAVDGITDMDSPYNSDSLSMVDHVSLKAKPRGQDILDTILNSEEQQNAFAKLESFVAANPKLSVFLGLNLAFTGVPLGLFILFVLSVGFSTLTIGLTVGLLGAGLFTATCVGFGLLILVPTLCFTTFLACSISFLALAGLYLFQWVFGSRERRLKYPQESGGSMEKSNVSRTDNWPTEFHQIVSNAKENQ